jgi:hypothetical protein
VECGDHAPSVHRSECGATSNAILAIQYATMMADSSLLLGGGGYSQALKDQSTQPRTGRLFCGKRGSGQRCRATLPLVIHK